MRIKTGYCVLGLLLLTMAATSSRAADTDVVINEIMYHPDTDCEGEEFIELHNRSLTTTVSLANWQFSEGVTFTFPPGTALPPNGYLVVCDNIIAFNDYYSTPSITLLGPWGGHLANDGEDIVLVNAAATVIDRVRYNDKRPWPISPDGSGPSLELINPNDDNTSAGAWRAATTNWLSAIWTRYEISGIASSTTVYLYLDGAGDCLIDDLELVATTNPVTNYINNGGFETVSPLEWTATGTHSGSVRVTTDACSGFACMKIMATGAGGEASGQVWQSCQPITFNGPRYTLSFWAKGLKPGVTLRVGMRGETGSAWAPTASQDIGSPPAAGGSSYNAGTNTYRVWGSGADIWGTSDQFHFVYAALTGDGALQATVSRILNPGGNGWAKAGVMIRESAAANSKYAFALLSWSNGVDFQFRTTTGGGAASRGTWGGGGPLGLRLTRQGDTLTAAADTGGGYADYAWTTIAMNPSVLIGLAVTSHDTSAPYDVATYDFAQPLGNVGGGFFTEVGAPSFFATPGARNSCYSNNVPPYIRNVDTSPDQPVSSSPIVVRAKITDSDGITSAVLRYQIVPPGGYIRFGDPAYQTNWVTVAMTAATTPTYYIASIPAQPHRTLVRYRVAARDGVGKETTVPYPDDPEPNYARLVYNGIPPYVAARQPGVTATTSVAVLTKIPALHLIANPADVNEAQTVVISDKVERREFKWYGTLVFNGKVYDHIRFRMRGGVWRYVYQKRMWKFRFNHGHYLDFVHNDGTKYGEELRTLDLLACIQTPHVPTWVSGKYGTNTQRGEAGFIERSVFWLLQQAGAMAPDVTWIHFRIVDDASEAGVDPNPSPPDQSQYYGDFFGLYLAVQGMDERMIRMNGQPDGNLYKMDDYGRIPGNPPWFQDAKDCSLPSDDINQFVNAYSANPQPLWWDQNLNLEAYYSTRAVVDFAHHGDMVGGKNWYYYHNADTLQWELIPWDFDLSFGTDYGDAHMPFRDRLLVNDSRVAQIPDVRIWRPGFEQFQIAYQNRLRECIQLLFCPEKFFPQLDAWRNLMIEIATADMYRWDWAPRTASSDMNPINGIFQPLDTRLADLKYWMTERIRFLTSPPTQAWSLERGWIETPAPNDNNWWRMTCWDPDIPTTPGLTTPVAGTTTDSAAAIVLASTAFSDPNTTSTHAASKWIATRVGGNELKPDWSAITTTTLTTATIPPGSLRPGDYWLRVRHMDNTGRWSWWSKQPVALAVAPPIAGNVIINSGAAFTTNTTVNLTLSATTTLPIVQMRFSDDNSTWSAWVPYATSRIWMLTSGDGLKTVYVQYRDSIGRVSSSCGDTITLDATAPAGNVTINSGAPFARALSVTLTLSATDGGSGVSQMRFSSNNVSWSAWEAYATSKTWTLTAGDGLKTAYVRFRDRTGNISTGSSDTIQVDMTAPTGSIVINNGAAKTASTSAALTLLATDGGSGVAQMRFSNNNTAWSAWEPYATRRTGWTLTSGDGLKTVYGQFRDLIGNISASCSDTITLETQKPSTGAGVWSLYN